jgi:hypothetical protein
MPILTPEDIEQLLANGRTNAAHIGADGNTEDIKPVVKLFAPWGAATWLLTELDPDDPDLAFGLCDLGFGCPEIGSVRISEIESVTGPGGLRVERDRFFYATDTLRRYAAEARRLGYILA